MVAVTKLLIWQRRICSDECAPGRLRAADRRCGTWPVAAESLWVAALLALAGGFLDAFTYFGHGRVFANAMTGNVVLLGVSAAMGNWGQAARYLLPIMAFLLGVATAQLFQFSRVRDLISHPPIASLTAEMAFLFGAGWYPKNFPDLPLVLGISFLAALQSSTFLRAEKWAYSSTVTTGDLRQFAQAGFKALFLGRDPEMTRQTKVFGIICLAFLVGATVGGLGVARMYNKALWVVDLFLLLAWLPMVAGARGLRAELDRPAQEEKKGTRE